MSYRSDGSPKKRPRLDDIATEAKERGQGLSPAGWMVIGILIPLAYGFYLNNQASAARQACELGNFLGVPRECPGWTGSHTARLAVAMAIGAIVIAMAVGRRWKEQDEARKAAGEGIDPEHRP